MPAPEPDSLLDLIIPHARQTPDVDYARKFTLGDWTTEKDSAAAFDDAVPSELFKLYKEVRGTLVNPRPAQRTKGELRIDRVLVPTKELLDLGWSYGIVGCEIKRSGIKIGEPLAQAMDYSRTVWTLEPFKFRVWLDYVFIWPMAQQGNTVGSILAQNRIGAANGNHSQWTRFQLFSGQNLLHVGQDGSIQVGSTQCGARVGSR